ncbi:hypothetical protein BCR39DRAFT_558390 [Naematelia encephala]|uniref:BZIP domain-containing protein n=1 Tax=Naematelia encephala TaxID=71784 RepID=A0A1Y2B944_9TREE|nr:hypothetical protein BCR39DRAFT_558390 [Naematelia encephala]
MNDPSPALTTTSTSTTAQSDYHTVEDFSDLFNFDGFDSADSSSHGQSPATISNHTPSPLVLPVQEPFTVDSDYDFNNANMDFTFDFPVEKSPVQQQQPIQQDIQIKQEPIDWSAVPKLGESSTAAPQPQQFDFTLEQQQALSAFAMSLMRYSSSAVLDNNLAPQPQTIDTSMVFSTTPANASASSSFISPSTTAPEPTPVALSTQEADEPLRAIEPNEEASSSSRSDRQTSVFSLNGDVDAQIDRLVPLPAIFSAGRGKGGKKGGGMSSVVRGDDEDIDDDDSWRPSPEEYKKLSSKEKRQLRNKLSARAFRTRRKDYIGTLESHIKDRDSVIDAMRAELINSRSENQDLRRELDALKASTMSILHPETAHKTSQSPAMLNALAMSPSLPVMPPTPKRTTTPVTINTRKDLASASTEASRGFWGGSDNLFGGSTICHTMFTPDLVLPPSPPKLKGFADLPRVNINPRLNELPKDSRMPSLAATGNGRDISSSTFSDWASENAFSLRSMDSYRMQMWSRLAREAQAEKQGLAADVRPKFFAEQKPTPAEASLAALATQHITASLASSFYSAFSGSTPGSLDTDKLTAVVTGKARLGVINQDFNEKHGADDADALILAMGGLKLRTGVDGPRERRGSGPLVRENPLGALCGFFGGVCCGKA